MNLLAVARNVRAVKDAAEQVYDRMLILRCQAGDEAALIELMGRYSPGVRFFLRKMTREAVADDLLQEVWFDVYRGIGKLQRLEAFAPWLYRIARDRAYRELRRRPMAALPEDHFADTPAAAEEDFRPDEAQRVRAALDQLPEEQREVLVLRFVEELSYEQIAEVIAHPVGTVRSRIHYGKLALRARLESASIRKEMSS